VSDPVCTVGNTVGSLSGVQHEVIVGSLLGDGSMRCKTNALLEINHSVQQRAYVDWKYSLLASLVATPPTARLGNAGRIAYRFVTRSLPELTPYYRRFYPLGRKTIPKVELTPLTMAVWFMDDGSRSRSAVYLNTQQFDEETQCRLLNELREQWGIEGSLNRDKSYHRIRLTVVGTVRFVELVGPHMLPGFWYKLPRVTP
jgi:hypothetical protein